jgi:sec-independent protein translocase protein TatC
MLSSAQSHLKKVFLVFVAVMMGSIWALRAFVWDRLKQDLVYRQMSDSLRESTEIIAVTPFDVILLQVKIGLIIGVLASLPVLIYVSRDALRARGYWPSGVPRWKVWGFLIAIALLFVGGSSYAYFLFFPIMFEFLAGNAVQVGFSPTWSIVMWTEFIFFLGMSFGVAAQLPLAMSSAARTGVVPYETFRDKWRYAVVGIFVFGAVFSPPDPFTQIMWGVPLVALYAVSLGVTKLAVLSKRAGESVSIRSVAREYWNLLAGIALLSGAAIYLYFLEGGTELLNELLAQVGSDYRFSSGEQIDLLGLSPTVAVLIVAALVALISVALSLFYLRIVELERISREAAAEAEAEPSEPGEPAEIDIGAMSARAIEATGPKAFTELSEERALEYAEQAVENDNPQKAKAIFDSYDEAQEHIAEQEAEAEAEAEDEDEENVITSTAAGVIDPFTEDETTEDDIGGYYYDIAFILDSLTSRAIWIVATFMIVLAGSFMFLYTGGIQNITDVFVQNMPPGVQDQFEIVTLHPVEALIFMLKFSTALAFVSIVPIVLYFAWPAIEQRGVGSGNRNVLLVWAGTMLVALVGGSLLGFLYIAPTIISLLANDVIASNMIIAYRISSFGWLVIYLTLGVGILSMIPTTMVLFYRGNLVSYRRMRKSWRGVVLAFFAVAGLLSPSGVFTMFLVAIPASLAYVFGLGLLAVYRRLSPNRPRPTGKPAD